MEKAKKKIEYRKLTDSEFDPWLRLTNLDELIWNGVYVLRVAYDDGTTGLPFRLNNNEIVTFVVKDHAHEGMLQKNRTIVHTVTYVDCSTGNVYTYTRTRHFVDGIHCWTDWKTASGDNGNVNYADLDYAIKKSEEELLMRIQGTSASSDALHDPFKFLGDFERFNKDVKYPGTSLMEALDKLHNVEGITGSSSHNGHFRATVNGSLVDIVNQAQGYSTDVWSQHITCSGMVLRNKVNRNETSYSSFSTDIGHKYRHHRYIQEFVSAVGGGNDFDVKGAVKTFSRRHYLVNNAPVWTAWYDTENPYVHSQNYGKKFALFGGSFAQNMAVNSSDYKFNYEGTSYNLVDYLAEKLGALAFDDYAVGGQGIRADSNSPFPVHLCRQLETAFANGSYDVFIIMGGVNDYMTDNVPLGESTGYASGNPSASEEQNSSYCGGLRKAIDYIRVNAPNAKIYTITPFKGYYGGDCYWNPRTSSRNRFGNSFYEFVQAHKEVAQVTGVPCLDLWAMQGFSGANASMHYISDLLHPNGQGYFKASEKILSFLASGNGNDVVDVRALVKSGIEDAVEMGRRLALRSLFVAAGAEYNGTGTDNTKIAPWGEAVTHKAGCYYLNGLGNITEAEMSVIYRYYDSMYNLDCGRLLSFASPRTIFIKGDSPRQRYNTRHLTGYYTFAGAQQMEVLLFVNKGYDNISDDDMLPAKGVLDNTFNKCSRLKYLGCIDCAEVSSFVNTFVDCSSLLEVRLARLKVSVSFESSSNISKTSVLYIIQNAVPSYAISMTLNPIAYARLVNDADVVAALKAQPLISLVSA